ncbi:MAG: aldolase/citrate lyase family protein [Nitrososphaerota archaeon]
MRKNPLKSRLRNGENVIGTFLCINSPAVVEIFGYAGFDFVIIDMEHGPFNFETVENMIRAAEASGITPIVRTPSSEETYILRALECGAAGVQVPHVDEVETAKQVIEAAMYYPRGLRGVSPYTKAAQYSAIDPKTHMDTSNMEVMTIIHIESQKGINNLPAMLDSAPVDVVFLGPYDLSQSLGIPGMVDDPRVIESITKGLKICREKGVAVGTFVESPERARRWMNSGIQYIAYSVDIGIFMRTVKQIIQNFK